MVDSGGYFLIVKAYNKTKKKEIAAEPVLVGPTEIELAQIRDALKKITQSLTDFKSEKPMLPLFINSIVIALFLC
jgi:hypothetical protein